VRSSDDVLRLAPSVRSTVEVTVRTEAGPAPDGVYGIPVPGGDGDVPARVGLSRAALAAAGFDGTVGDTAVVPGDGGTVVAIGVGDPDTVNAGALRDAAAAFAGAVPKAARLTIVVPATGPVPADAAAQALVEGALLNRYRFEVFKADPAPGLAALTLLVAPEQAEAATAGARRGTAYARATAFARDLANAPPGKLTAIRIAEIAAALGPDHGLEVEVFDRDALVALGCGGLLGVNQGSADPPRMIRLTYAPADARGHVSLVGKGIMYDSGGISLKPADEVHATMKNDMSGAAAILAAMCELKDLNCRTAVTGWLMCTDNMPSGTALKLGDVITMRGGTNVEVLNADAEGRLVMADALVLATEGTTDAIIDIATLTGACLRALGPDIAGVLGNRQGLVDQILAAAGATGEPVWQLPLAHRYRKWLNSPIADVKNVGGSTAGAITAALFLADFVGEIPWAHLDIAGTAQNDTATSWRPDGCTGFGARLLLELLTHFDPKTAGTVDESVRSYALTGVKAS
jgi:leucyl aminopeptidase